MPRQVYRCSNPEHGEFEVNVPVKEDVPKVKACPAITRVKVGDSWLSDICGHWSKWVPSVPNFIGGPTTGAKKE